MLTIANLILLNFQHVTVDSVLCLGRDLGENTATQIAFARDHPDIDGENDIFTGYLQGARGDEAFGEVVAAKTAALCHRRQICHTNIQAVY